MSGKAPVNTDSIVLMRQLAKFTGAPDGYFRRMVLVLDVADAPRLYTESFLDSSSAAEKLQAPEGIGTVEAPVIVNTTTMQNEKFITRMPLVRQPDPHLG